MARFEFDASVLRRPAIALLLVLTVAATLVWLSGAYRADREAELQRARAELGSVRTQYRLAVEAGGIIRASHRQHAALRQRGFVGAEQRLLWIESLRNSGLQSRVLNLNYSLKQQQAVQLAGAEYSASYQLYASPMQLNVELTHEVDLLRFFAALEQEQVGVYQIDACYLNPLFSDSKVDSEKANVAASCQLRWYTVRPLDEVEDAL
jgi:hypothetical protein